MLEAAIALVGVAVCWLAAVSIYEDEMSLGRYALLALLGAAALYFFVRFVHWAWLTPIPFTGKT
jgi:hypothetical protein